MKKYEAILITIPKDYDFSEKLEAIRTYGMFAYHYTKNKPTKDYEKVLVLHNDTLYECERYDTELGIGFHSLSDRWKTSIKGFQGFRYIEDINKFYRESIDRAKEWKKCLEDWHRYKDIGHGCVWCNVSQDTGNDNWVISNGLPDEGYCYRCYIKSCGYGGGLK